jgi:hypothetical protein
VSYHVDFYEFRDNGDLSANPVPESSTTTSGEPEFVLTQAIVGFIVKSDAE